MNALEDAVRMVSRIVNVVAGISLTFIMLLTVSDVILRSFRRPILGTYELVAFAGAVVIGFSLPYTTWLRGHIFVDFFVQKFSKTAQNIFNIITRCLGLGLFFLIGWNLILLGRDLIRTGEVSLTLELPFYYVAFALGGCCFIQCLVLVCDILKIAGGRYE